MNGVVSEFKFAVHARTRDECLQLIDNMAFDMLAKVGGAPWIAIDDDVQRLHVPQSTMADDMGFLYQGIRSYKFGGPLFAHDGQPLHDHFDVQNSIKDEL